MSLCSFISGHDIWVRTVLDNGLMYAVERLSFIGASTIGDLTVYCMCTYYVHHNPIALLLCLASGMHSPWAFPIRFHTFHCIYV